MKTKTTLYVLTVVILALAQSACQPQAAAQAAPMPLTGKNASRLGTAALTIQQKTGSTHSILVPVSASTGDPLKDAAPVDMGVQLAMGFSADRSRIAFVSSQMEGCLNACLRLLDLRSWKESKPSIPVGVDFGAWLPEPAFNAGSTRVALVFNRQEKPVSQVQLIDIAQARVIQKVTLNAVIYQAVFTPQGTLALYGFKGSEAGKYGFTSVFLLDGADLHTLWEQDITNIRNAEEWAGDLMDPTQGRYLYPASVFTQDGSRLYIAAADDPTLVMVDFAHRSVRSAAIQARMSWLDRLMASTAGVVYAKTLNGTTKKAVLSQDERYLYIVGQTTTAVKGQNGDYTQDSTSLDLQVVDTQDAALLQTIATDATDIAISQDGTTLLLGGWTQTKDGLGDSWTDALDIRTFTVTQRLKGRVQPSRLLDGSLAWLASEQTNANTYRIALYRPRQAVLLSQLQGPGAWAVDWIPIP